MSLHLPPRKVRERMNVQAPARVECRGHLTFVRTKHLCALAGKIMKSTGEPHVCEGRIDPHHVVSVGAGGGDEQAAPLCRTAHNLGESWGWSWARIKTEYGVDLPRMAADLWKIDTYHRFKFEREWREAWPDAPLPYTL